MIGDIISQELFKKSKGMGRGRTRTTFFQSSHRLGWHNNYEVRNFISQFVGQTTMTITGTQKSNDYTIKKGRKQPQKIIMFILINFDLLFFSSKFTDFPYISFNRDS